MKALRNMSVKRITNNMNAEDKILIVKLILHRWKTSFENVLTEQRQDSEREAKRDLEKIQSYKGTGYGQISA